MSDALDKFRDLVVCVGVPSNGMWHEKFGISFMNMLNYIGEKKVGQYRSCTVGLSSQVGSILPKQRWNIVKQARNLKADYILWLDSDQTFPAQTIHRLVSFNKDIIAANVATKRIPAEPTARGKPTVEHPHGAPVYTDKGDEKIEQVWRVGTGVMLTRTSVFDKIPPSCFEMKYKPDVDSYGGEDWNFLDLAELAGYEFWVDHGLSNRVGHLGTFEFTHDWVGEVRDPSAVILPEAANHG